MSSRLVLCAEYLRETRDKLAEAKDSPWVDDAEKCHIAEAFSLVEMALDALARAEPSEEGQQQP